jgi:hypothetical protein
MKSLLVFATLSILTVSVSGQPYNASDHKQQPAAQTNPSITVPAPEKHNDGKTDKGKTYTDPSEWRTAVKRPEWWLVLLGFITCGVVGWQAWETRAASTAARDSIRLQEVAYKQWVELTNWRSEKLGPTSLVIKVDIVNSTNFPLTLTSACITIGLADGIEAHLICKDRFLPPKEPVDMSVPIELTEPEIPSFHNNSLGFSTKGSIEFKSILNRPEVQKFQGLLFCGTSDTRFEYTIPQPKADN